MILIILQKEEVKKEKSYSKEKTNKNLMTMNTKMTKIIATVQG